MAMIKNGEDEDDDDDDDDADEEEEEEEEDEDELHWQGLRTRKKRSLLLPKAIVNQWMQR